MLCVFQTYLLLNKHRRPTVRVFNQSSEWWDVNVPGFTHEQWLQNFRMSEQTFIYLCDKLRPALERQNTSFSQCVPLKKMVAIALWRLATGSKYRSVGHLFGVRITTVYRCVQEFCAAAETLLVPEKICFPDEERFRDMAISMENGGSHSVWGLLVTATCPSWYHRTTQQVLKLLWMERGCSGICLLNCQGAPMTPGFSDCPCCRNSPAGETCSQLTSGTLAQCLQAITSWVTQLIPCWTGS